MQVHREQAPPPLRKPRLCLTVLVIACLLLAVAALVVRALPLSNVVALVLAVGSPYVILVALTGFALALLSRRRVLSLLAVVVLGATVAAQVPWYYFARSPDIGQHADIRVLSSNLRKGQADAAAFVGLATESADVLTVSELTPEAAQRFSEAGIDRIFPHSVLIPAAGAAGIGLWSRFPLTEVSSAKRWNIAAARLQIPGVRFDPLVASVHIISPVAYGAESFDSWRNGIASKKQRMADFAHVAREAAVVVAGDFNSTPDMQQFRDLLTRGYRDAVEQTGAGFAPTFPVHSWSPPWITIDHVLTRNAAAASITTVTLPGSDHRALLATVQVPLDPTAS